MFRVYRTAAARWLNKEIDWDTDTITCTLHTSTYAPNYDTHSFVSSLTNELATSGGYTVGGINLASKTVTFTAANSWATARANATVYALGFIVRPSTGNGFVYRASVAGTSHATTPPTFPTVIGTTVTDGSVTWTCVGAGIVVVTAAPVTWTSATFSGVRYAIISDRQTGVTTTEPLIGAEDFITDKAAQGGAFTAQWSSQGIFQFPTP